MKTWKFYRASTEAIREPSVFAGPLDTEGGDIFVHYLRQGVLGKGTDYFGIYTEDHAGWLAAQPPELAVTEITAAEVPDPNVYTQYQAWKAAQGRETDDIGLEI